MGSRNGKEKGLKAAEAFKVMTLVEGEDGRRINQLSATTPPQYLKI